MKKNFLIVFALLAAAVAVFSCSKAMTEQRTDADSSEVEQKDNQIVTITAYLPEDDADTRVSITEAGDYKSAQLAWQENDQLQLVCASGSFTFGIDNSSIEGNKATFNLVGSNPIGDGPYTIFYHPSRPLTLDAFNAISYDGQVQSGNGSTAHLKCGMKLSNVNSYESIVFSNEWAQSHSEGNAGTLTEDSVLQLLLKVPDEVTEVYSIYVHDNGSFKQTLWLTNGANLFVMPNSVDVVKAYMMVPDMDLTGPLTIRVEAKEGAYEVEYPLTGTADWVGGKQYTIQKNLSGLSAITGEHAAMEIHAKSAQDILQFRAGVNAGQKIVS